MPQFDKITFFNQIFWLFVFFSGYYLLLLKVFLPKLGAVLKARAKNYKKEPKVLLDLNKSKKKFL
jgi:F0F1-type ATP synthase membrane subunit b/b'